MKSQRLVLFALRLTHSWYGYEESCLHLRRHFFDLKFNGLDQLSGRKSYQESQSCDKRFSLNKLKVLLLIALFALPALGSAPQTESQNVTTATSMMTVTTPYTSTFSNVSAEMTLVNATETSASTEFNFSDTLLPVSPCFYSSWTFVANSSQLISATANSTEGLDVYLTSLNESLVWLQSGPCAAPPKSVQLLAVARNVTSVTVNYRVPQNVQPNTSYNLLFLYFPQGRTQAARLTVTIMTASSEVYTATTILYSTRFQQSVYNTVQTMTPFTVSAEQGFLSPYSMLIIALVALVAVIAYAYVKTRRK